MKSLRSFSSSWRAAFAAALSCAALGCDANVVDAVREPAPVMMPEPEPVNPLQTSLFHRYSFDGEGTLVLDSKGGAHGEVFGTELAGDGTLPLLGERSGQYVNLPNKLISGLSDATFEVWLTWHGGGNWQRLFDFGNSSSGEDSQGSVGTSYLFLTAASGPDSTRSPPSALRAVFSTNGPDFEDICHGQAPLTTDEPSHVALVIEQANEMMTLYRDGALEVQCSLARPLSLIEDINNWLGRSNYAADPDLSGSYDEFRIYKAALTAEELAESYSAGPDAGR